MFFFLITHELNICSVKVTRKSVNTGYGKGMKVPCKQNFRGNIKIIKMLKSIIYNKYHLKNIQMCNDDKMCRLVKSFEELRGKK